VIGPPGQGFRLRVPLSKPARLAISPDGSEVFTWPMLDPGAWQVRLDDGEVTRTWDERVRDAAYAPDGTLAVLLDDGVQIEGKLRRVKGLEHLSELAWSPDGEHLAVMSAQTVAVLSASGRVRCTMDLPVRVGGDLLWAGSLYVGDRELTSPIRIDPATCERRGSPYLGPPHTVLAVPGAWLTADSSRIALWDRDTGALLHTAGRSTAGHAVDALTLLPSGNLGVVDRDQGLVAELSLPELEVLHE